MSAALLDDSLDQNVELWKIKKLIKSLEACRGFAPTNEQFNIKKKPIKNEIFIFQVMARA